MEYYLTIKITNLSQLVRSMNLEPIIQSEVSQKEKSKYQILMQICMESRKIVSMNLFAAK